MNPKTQHMKLANPPIVTFYEPGAYIVGILEKISEVRMTQPTGEVTTARMLVFRHATVGGCGKPEEDMGDVGFWETSQLRDHVEAAVGHRVCIEYRGDVMGRGGRKIKNMLLYVESAASS